MPHVTRYQINAGDRMRTPDVQLGKPEPHARKRRPVYSELRVSKGLNAVPLVGCLGRLTPKQQPGRLVR